MQRSPIVTLSTLDVKNTWIKPRHQLAVAARNVAPYNNSFETLVKDLKQYRKNGYRVLLLSGSRTRAKRLAEDLRDNEISGTVKIGDILEQLQKEDTPAMEDIRSYPLEEGITAGDLLDAVATDKSLQKHREEEFQYDFTVGEVLDLLGEEKMKGFMEENAAERNRLIPTANLS